MMKILLSIVGAVVLSLCGVGTTSAISVLYGTDIDTDSLVRFDLNTGQGTAVGSIRGPLGSDSNIESLAYDPIRNVFYGFEHYSNTLVEFSKQPSGFTLISDPFIHLLYNGVDGNLTNLARNPLDANYYFMASSYLHRWDFQLNQPVLVGEYSHVTYTESLTFDTDGTLWGVDCYNGLFGINPLTGDIVSSVELSHPYNSIQGIAFNPQTGDLYAARLGQMWIIDPFTGTVTQTFNTSFSNIRDLTFIDDPAISIPAPVPEPSTILLMGIGILGLVGMKARKKKS
jgi:hypothetical protein